MITAFIIICVTLLCVIAWLVGVIFHKNVEIECQKNLRNLDNEYVQHYIHVVNTYRKWKKEILELKAMLRDCHWDFGRKRILRSINQNQKSVRMLRSLLNKYYFDYNGGK